MKLRAFNIATALVLGTGAVVISAQTPPGTLDDLVSTAKVAAGTDWSGTFTRLCIPPPSAPGAPQGRGVGQGRGAGAGGAAPAPPPRDRWHAEPAKVADNLYFVGT